MYDQAMAFPFRCSNKCAWHNSIRQNQTIFTKIDYFLCLMYWSISFLFTMVSFFCHFFSSRQKQLNEQNFDYILSWQENFNPLNSAHFMESNAFTANEMMMTHSNRRPNMQPDGTGVGAQQSNKSKKPHTVLLRRRHSLPEIIMRK